MESNKVQETCDGNISSQCQLEIQSADLNIKDEKILYVVIPIFNPKQYKTRYRLYFDFMGRMKYYATTNKTKIEIYVIEAAFANRPFVVTQKNNPNHIQVRSNSEIWLKENLINIAVSHLPQSWKYMAWIDADISFSNHTWVDDTIAGLQHHPIVQLFQTAVDLGPDGEFLQMHHGFAYMYKTSHKLMFESQEIQSKEKGKIKYNEKHPGFAWAITKRAFNQLGGLLDIGILGACDHHCALAFIGRVRDSVHQGVTQGYKNRLYNYEILCNEYISGNIGYVNGSIHHYWHGKKKNRFYIDRWSILVKNKYDPDTDLKKEWNGVYALDLYSTRQKTLAREIQDYFSLRNEDSIDL